MIDEVDRERCLAEPFRLASLPRERLQALFLRRGIPEDSIDDSIQCVADLGTPVTLEDAISFPFRSSPWRTPSYGSGRFHDGQEYGVYYSALDADTCFEEVQFHLRDDGLEKSLAYPRYYHLIQSRFEGTALELLGHEVDHPELISADQSGYPFCQRLAAEAVLAEIAALKTRSARTPEGICLPVLVEQALSGHRIVRSLRMRSGNDDIEVENLA